MDAWWKKLVSSKKSHLSVSVLKLTCSQRRIHHHCRWYTWPSRTPSGPLVHCNRVTRTVLLPESGRDISASSFDSIAVELFQEFSSVEFLVLTVDLVREFEVQTHRVDCYEIRRIDYAVNNAALTQKLGRYLKRVAVSLIR
jgi:hypothetical protein